jgi:hypothetical protein
MEHDDVSCDPLYHYGFTQLEEVLEMCIGILIWFAAEWSSLHHVNETRFELKVHVLDVDVGSGDHVDSGGDGEIMESLFGHRFKR